MTIQFGALAAITTKNLTKNMTKAKTAYLFIENQQWFIHEDGVNSPISAEYAQELAEDGLPKKSSLSERLLVK